MSQIITRSLAFVFLVLSCNRSLAQRGVVSVNRLFNDVDTIYSAYENHIDYVRDGLLCDSLNLFCNELLIDKYKCSYWVLPQIYEGMVTIKVLRNDRLDDSFQVYVSNSGHLPIPILGARSHAERTILRLKYRKIILNPGELRFNKKFQLKIKSFTIELYSKVDQTESLIYTEHAVGDSFSKTFLKRCGVAKPGDYILLSSVIITDSKGKEFILPTKRIVLN